MNKLFYPYWEWEESQTRLWDNYNSELDNLENVLATMQDVALFSSGMGYVVRNWRISCLQNLTDFSQNRIAWLGQASVAHLLNASSIATRMAWNQMRKDLQIASNAVADYWIKQWELENNVD